MHETLQEAIRLRESGKLEMARTILLGLARANPEDPQINYQTAWVHDSLGLDRESAPYYERAITNGLTDPDLEDALLALGCTYRALGEYQKAAEICNRGMKQFPSNRAFQVFLAITLYNIGDYSKAFELLLRNLAETTSDPKLIAQKRSFLFYAPNLNQTWD